MKYLNKSFSVAGGACFRPCRHQNTKVCSRCFRINGRDTEYEEEDGGGRKDNSGIGKDLRGDVPR